MQARQWDLCLPAKTLDDEGVWLKLVATNRKWYGTTDKEQWKRKEAAEPGADLSGGAESAEDG